MLILTVGDIKQFFYCPRVVYFRYLVPRFKPITYKMEEGKLRQREEEKLEKRRGVSRFGLKGNSLPEVAANMAKLFNVYLHSNSHGLSGLLDMALVSEREAVPVDFKDGAFSRGRMVALHHKYQLLAYGLLLEETFRKRCPRGFAHSLEDGTTKSVAFSDGAKMFLKGKIKKMRQMILEEIFPDETPYKGRCRECEFRPLCKG